MEQPINLIKLIKLIEELPNNPEKTPDVIKLVRIMYPNIKNIIKNNTRLTMDSLKRIQTINAISIKYPQFEDIQYCISYIIYSYINGNSINNSIEKIYDDKHNFYFNEDFLIKKSFLYISVEDYVRHCIKRYNFVMKNDSDTSYSCYDRYIKFGAINNDIKKMIK